MKDVAPLSATPKPGPYHVMPASVFSAEARARFRTFCRDLQIRVHGRVDDHEQTMTAATLLRLLRHARTSWEERHAANRLSSHSCLETDISGAGQHARWLREFLATGDT